MGIEGLHNKKIAVICASPRKFNPGMFSVDLAFHFLLKRHKIEAEVNYFILAHPSDDSFQSEFPFKYELAQENLEKIHNSDAIVFWGDFLHSQMYYHGFPKRLIKGGYALDKNEADKIIKECLFLSKMPDAMLSKCLLFGSTQLLDPNNALADDSYLKLSNRLIRGAKRVWVRDIYTALKVSRLRKASVNSTHGIDASFFLTDSDIVIKGGGALQLQKRVGLFFDRTKVSPVLPLRFSKSLCDQLELEAEWLPWFQPITRKYSRGLKKHFPNIGSNAIDYQPSVLELLSSLSKYSLIITDTYHLCLNAWCAGVPAICITNGNEMSPGTLQDKKKEVFYFTNEAQDFLVDIETLNVLYKNIFPSPFNNRRAHDKKQLLIRLEECATNSNIANAVIKNIEEHKVVVENDFVSSLNELIC